MASDQVDVAASEVEEPVKSSDPGVKSSDPGVKSSDPGVKSSDRGFDLFQDRHLQKRAARVTVKYNRRELQRRLDVEKWIDEAMDKLYFGKEVDMPEEVNIDDLIDLPNDEERVKSLQELLQNCTNKTQDFIQELVGKLEGLHKQDDLQSEGIEHPVISHSHYRHEPYHFSNVSQQSRSPNQTL